MLYKVQSQYAQAEPLYQRSLRIFEKALGPEHPDVAASLNNLAGFYSPQGQHAQAEPLYKRSLGIREKALGSEHPDVAQSLNNLAALYKIQGQYAQAEPLLQRSVRTFENVLNPQHPQVAIALSNLALLHQAQGQYAKAEPLLQRSLRIHEKSLNPQHPEVARTLNNLAALYDAQGQYAQAEPLYQRSLRMFEKALGSEHPDVATALNSLAAFYSAQSQYAQAEPLYQRSLDIRRKTLGPEHPDVAASLNNLASLHQAQHTPAQALPYLRKSASIREGQLRATVSEPRMQALIDMLREEEDRVYGLLLGPEVQGAKELVMQVALLRKGRVAAAGAAANQVMQRSLGRAEIATQFAEWQAVRQQHEVLLFGGLGKLSPTAYRQQLQDTKLRAESLEAQLASGLPDLATLLPPQPEAIVAQVAARLKPGSALVEVVWARPYHEGASAEGKPWATPPLWRCCCFPTGGSRRCFW